jgi:hypothetical protein
MGAHWEVHTEASNSRPVGMSLGLLLGELLGDQTRKAARRDAGTCMWASLGRVLGVNSSPRSGNGRSTGEKNWAQTGVQRLT